MTSTSTDQFIFSLRKISRTDSQHHISVSLGRYFIGGTIGGHIDTRIFPGYLGCSSVGRRNYSMGKYQHQRYHELVQLTFRLGIIIIIAGLFSWQTTAEGGCHRRQQCRQRRASIKVRTCINHWAHCNFISENQRSWII